MSVNLSNPADADVEPETAPGPAPEAPTGVVLDGVDGTATPRPMPLVPRVTTRSAAARGGPEATDGASPTIVTMTADRDDPTDDLSDRDRPHRDRGPVRLLRRVPRRSRRFDDDPAARRDRDHRPVGLRQEHVPAIAQPHARARDRRPHRRPPPARRHRPLRSGDRPRPAATDRGHGVPAAEPVPDHVHLRQRGRRAPAHRPPAEGPSWTRRSSAACVPRRSGTRSRTSSSSPERRCRAGSSSDCASRGRSPWTRRSC